MKKLLLVSLCFLLLSMTQVFAQNRTVTGTVTSKDDGQPMPGVTVRVKGSTVGSQTNAAGKFSVSVPAGTKALEFYFIGFLRTEIAIPGNNTMFVALSSDTRQLGEVVVSAGGLSVKRGQQGYASTTLKPELITQSKAINVGSALSGKVAGLQVNTVSSGVNPTVRLVLRGNRSLLGNNQALIVLDNIIVPNAILGNINPEDIDDIQVLNGPGAAALYGSDASNGALVITTKKGKNGSTVVRVSNTTSLEKVSFYPKLQNQFGSGSNNDIQAYIPYENQQYGPRFDGVVRPVGRVLEDGTQQMLPYSPTDSKNDFWDTGVTNQTDFSISQGDEKSTLYVAGQYVKQSGTTPGDKYNRFSLRVNGTKELVNRVSVNYNVNYVQNRYDVTTQTASMYDQILQTPGEIRLTDYSDWQNNKFANPNGYYNEYYMNPYYTKDNNRQNVRNDYLLGKAEIKYRPIDALSIIARGGITTSNQSYKAFTNKFVFTPFTKNAATSYKKNDIAGGVTDGSSYSTQLVGDLLATYIKSVKDFTFNLTVGGQIRNNVDNAQTISATGLVQQGVYNVAQRFTPSPDGGQSIGIRHQLGVYGDFKIGYKDYLTLDVTGRNDWLSVLAPKNRSFFYPSANVAFIPTNAFEELKESKVINSLKIRASISKVGQANIGAYSLVPIYVQAAGYPYSSGPGYSVDNRLISPDLKPEITKSFEAGFDADFLNSRITTSFTFYKSQTTNQTVPTGVSNATGFTSFLVNAGQVDNTGIESTVSFVPVKTISGFQLTVGANFTYNNNKVVSISKDLDILALSTGGTAQTYAIKGMSYPVIRGTDYARDPQGRVIVDPVTGYPSAAAQPVILGNSSPKDRLGLNIEFKYKSFRLAGLAEFRGGFSIYNNAASGYDFSGSSLRSVQYNRERFVFPNSSYLNPAGQYVANTNIMVADGGAGFFADNNRNLGIASNYVYSGNSWKIREISLSYDIPGSLLGNRKYVKSATISVQGRNLFLWVPKQNMYTDPEYNFTDGNAIGITTLDQTPPTRYFGATLSLTL